MKTPRPRENPWINILVNVVAPTLILSRGSEVLGVVPALLLALAFPLAYGLWDLWARRVWNFFSILGLVSVGLTASIGLFELGPELLAWKEALIPGIVGLVVLVTAWTPFPLVQKMLEAVIDWEGIRRLAVKRQQEQRLARLLQVSTILLAGSFFVSSLLNFALASFIVTSPAGTEAFNQELGTMTALTLPVILIPSFLILFGIMVYLLKVLGEVTGRDITELLTPRE